MKWTIVVASGLTSSFWRFNSAAGIINPHVYFPIDVIRMSELRGKVRARPGRSPARSDHGSRNNLPILRGAVARPRGSVPSQIFPSSASKETRWQTLIRARPNQRNSKASAARNFAIQDLVLVGLFGL
jgi:hypothetical protein